MAHARRPATRGTAWLGSLALSALVACQSSQVSPVDPQGHRLVDVCVERNPAVFVPAMLPALRDHFRRNGVPTVVRDARDLSGCAYVVRYRARRAQGLGPYTSEMGIEIFEGDAIVGKLAYSHGGLSPSKFVRTADALDPLITRLLEGQRP